jgi:hypothetical protein
VRTTTAAFIINNEIFNAAKGDFDVSGNDYAFQFVGYDPSRIWAFQNHQGVDASGTISRDVVTPLKFSGSSALGDPLVPPDGSMVNGQSTMYIDPQTAFISTRYQDLALDDISSAGAYTGTGDHTWTVQVTAAGAPDVIQWRKDSGAWTTGVLLTGANQVMSDGVAFRAASTTGHRAGTSWTIVGRTYPIAISFNKPAAEIRTASGRGLPFTYPSSTSTVVISGYTGAWSAANGTWTATIAEAFVFSIPLNSSGFGAATGTPIYSLISPGAQKTATPGVSVGADKYYFHTGQIGDPNESLSYKLAGIDGPLLKGYGGGRLSRAIGGGTECAQSMIQWGGYNEFTPAYLSSILMGLGNCLPQVNATVEIANRETAGQTYTAVIEGDSQGATPLMGFFDKLLNLNAWVKKDGSASFASLLVAGSPVRGGDLSGDVTTAGTNATTLAASGVGAGTYTSVTVDAKGRVTAGSTPAISLPGGSITCGVSGQALKSVALSAGGTLTGTCAIP